MKTTVEFLKINYILDNIKKSVTINSRTKEFTSEDFKVNSEIIRTIKGRRIYIKIIPSHKIQFSDLCLEAGFSYGKNDKIFCNGYQSWTESREFSPNEKIKRYNILLNPILEFYKVKNFGDSKFFKYTNKKGEFQSYTYSYVRQGKGNINFFGSIDEKNGFTIFKHIVKKNKLLIIKDCKNLFIDKEYAAFSLFISEGNEKKIFNDYFNYCKLKKPFVKPAAGWTSWYNYYNSIDEKVIIQNLENFNKNNIPIDIFQIDDGYQNAIGDWLETSGKFPHGMKIISDLIKKKGIKAGIWISPFICQKLSNIFKEHPEWILKNKKGKPFRLGYSRGYWNDHFFVMDLYNADFRDYIKKVFDNIINIWGFDFIKIDFLYALSHYSIPDKTRAGIFSDAVNFLKGISGNAMLLGCGTPLAPGFGNFSYCRVGSDISLTWENGLYKFINYRERVSTINSIMSTIHRRHLDGRAFGNDPDVYILRDENNSLNKNQKFTLFLLNQIFGSLVFTSDDISKYSDETLRIYLSQFPVLKKEIISVESDEMTYKIRFEINRLTYVAYANLKNKKASIILGKTLHFSNKTFEFQNQEKITLSPYESVCFLVSGNKNFELAGSTGHLFPCSEVSGFNIRAKNIILKISNKSICKGKIFIRVPAGIKKYKVNNKFINSKVIGKFNFLIYEP